MHSVCSESVHTIVSHPAFVGVGEDQRHRREGGQRERNAVAFEERVLEDPHDEIQARGRAQRARKDEEARAGAMRAGSEPLAEVVVEIEITRVR